MKVNGRRGSDGRRTAGDNRALLARTAFVDYFHRIDQGGYRCPKKGLMARSCRQLLLRMLMRPFRKRGIDGHGTIYFDVCTDGVTVVDEDGLDLLGAATTRLEAGRAAAEMMRDRCAAKAVPVDVSITVRDCSPKAGEPREPSEF